MRTRLLMALGIGSALALGGAALAQQPAPSPAPAPPPDYGPPITNEQAKTVAAAALAEAKKNNWRMAFTIVGPAGELVYFEKMDGTQMASSEISQGKARTAAMPPGGFRLAVVNAWDLQAGLAGREMLHAHFAA